MSQQPDLGLGPVDQVGYVVADLDASLPRYRALFGPFEVSEAPMQDVAMGEARIDCRLKLAVNRSGPVEIELIQVLEGDTPHSRHLASHGEGLHHVRFRVADLDAHRTRLEDAGYRTTFHKRFGPTVAFAYLERRAPRWTRSVSGDWPRWPST